MRIYVVKKFDTVNRIALETGVAPEQIIFDNQLLSPYQIAVGQALLLTDGRVSEEGGELREAVVNGYAYPFIGQWTLRQTLPFLSEISVFSYGFTMEGNLIPPQTDDSWLVTTSREGGVKPILTIAPLDENGRFNNYLISAVVNQKSVAVRLRQQLLSVMREKNYMGLDIDFEYILASDRDAFSTFVADTVEVMHQYGYTVSVALAPKISSQQKGLLYEGKDYGAIGSVADSVLLMTYEWGYTYGPPMAVAPISMVRQVVEYAVTEIPRQKIRLGIPNYGYDWPLPFQQGITKARTLGNVEASRLASIKGVPIQFDTTAQSPWFTYEENGVKHEVWFEDVRSLQAKFQLMKEFSLGGCGYWNLMQFFRANWLLLQGNFDSAKLLL